MVVLRVSSSSKIARLHCAALQSRVIFRDDVMLERQTDDRQTDAHTHTHQTVALRLRIFINAPSVTVVLSKNGLRVSESRLIHKKFRHSFISQTAKTGYPTTQLVHLRCTKCSNHQFARLLAKKGTLANSYAVTLGSCASFDVKLTIITSETVVIVKFYPACIKRHTCHFWFCEYSI